MVIWARVQETKFTRIPVHVNGIHCPAEDEKVLCLQNMFLMVAWLRLANAEHP